MPKYSRAQQSSRIGTEVGDLVGAKWKICLTCGTNALAA